MVAGVGESTLRPRLLHVQKYPARSGQLGSWYQYDANTDELQESEQASGKRQGWLFGDGRDVITRKRHHVVVFRMNDQLWLHAAGHSVPLGAGSTVLRHERGLVWSSLQIASDGKALVKLKFPTPWWRWLLDDGMFPQDRDPMEALAKFQLEPERISRVLAALRETSPHAE